MSAAKALGSCGSAGGFVEHVGIKIDAIGPGERTRLMVDRDLGEKGAILERMEHATRPATKGVRSTMP